MFRKLTLSHWLVATYCAVGTAILFAILRAWHYDDPFITYRYAQNLKRGFGLVYNPGARVLSTTAPLFAALLAGGSFVWRDIPQVANWIGMASIMIGAAALWDIARQWGQSLVGWVALLLYPLAAMLLNTIGSEMPLYLGLCLLGVAAYTRRKLGWVALWFALATLTRADALVLAGLLGLDYAIREVRAPQDVPWKVVFVFLGILALAGAAGWGYYGSPVPATLAAKRAQGIMLISDSFWDGLVQLWGRRYTSWHNWLADGLWLVGLGWALRKDRRWLVLLVWPLVYVAAYAGLGVTRYFWYYAPLVPGMVLGTSLGLGMLTPRGEMKWGWLRLAGYASILLILIYFGGRDIQNMRPYQDARYPIYRAVGEWLSENTPENASVGMLEVGIIGYYAERPIVGFTGLIQPEVAAQIVPESDFQSLAVWALDAYAPRFAVLHDGVFPRVEREYMAGCVRVAVFAGDDYGYSRDVSVYDCR